jgi:hypothetical protein
MIKQLKNYKDIINNDTSTQDSSALAELNSNIDSLITLKSEVFNLGIPIGWMNPDIKPNIKSDNGGSIDFGKLGLLLLGWLITIFAITAGAPFWFKLMAKLVNIRNSGLLPDTNKKKKE